MKIGRRVVERSRELKSSTATRNRCMLNSSSRRQPSKLPVKSKVISGAATMLTNHGKYIHTISMTHIKCSSEFMLSTSTHVSAVAARTWTYTTACSRWHELFVSDIPRQHSTQAFEFHRKTITVLFIFFQFQSQESIMSSERIKALWIYGEEKISIFFQYSLPVSRIQRSRETEKM